MQRLFSRFPLSRLLLTCALPAVFAVGCGNRVPDYAKATGGTMDPTAMEGRDRISYRHLKPSDFLAQAPPPEMEQYAERMGAVTCAHVYAEPDPLFYIEETPEGFHGAYEHLNFVAKMDRQCSWWNPTKSHVPEEYILQHEQIHFALAESAARRLDKEAQELIKTLHPRGKTQSEVEKILIGTVEEMLKNSMEKLLDRNRRFDQDTSNTYAPEKQQKWYDEVMAELR